MIKEFILYCRCCQKEYLLIQTTLGVTNDIILETSDVFIARYLKITPQKKVNLDFAIFDLFGLGIPGLPASNAATMALDVLACYHPSKTVQSIK